MKIYCLVIGTSLVTTTRAMLKIFTITLFIVSLPTKSSELKKIDDLALSHILATQEVIYKSNSIPNITLIQSWEQISECGANYDSCPNARLFVVVNSGDLYEVPKLYELPLSKGWSFVRSFDDGNQTIIIVKTMLDNSNLKTHSRNKWVSTSYKIAVSKDSGSVVLIK